MAKTFCNDALTAPGRHRSRAGYIMSGSWIDTTAPCDMMDYDFTGSWRDLLAASNETHADWCAGQARP